MQTPRLDALRTAVPYIRSYRGRYMVVKLGGLLCNPGDVLDHVVDQLGVLYQLGVKLVVVHGGGEQVTELGRRFDRPPTIVAGRRVTDAQWLELAKMTFAGKVNTDILAACRRHSVPGVGLSGIDGGLITVRRRPPTQVTDPSTGQRQEVDFGYVGDVEAVRVDVLRHLVDGGYVPIVCSLASDDAGQVYNVNADTIASAIAVALKAAKYITMTNVDGVFADVSDHSTLKSYVDLAELEAMIESGAVSGGMLPKLAASTAALRGGVARAHLINGTAPNTLLAEIFTNEGCGTLIVPAGAKGAK